MIAGGGRAGKRWLAFSVVGAFGIVVQVAFLAAFTSALSLHYLLATALAVEAAVVHNFIWHERWTWRDRSRQDPAGQWQRLLRFQIANGALSLGGNVILMHVFVAACGLNYTVSNLLSIGVCALLNFIASDHWVFRLVPVACSGPRNASADLVFHSGSQCRGALTKPAGTKLECRRWC